MLVRPRQMPTPATLTYLNTKVRSVGSRCPRRGVERLSLHGLILKVSRLIGTPAAIKRGDSYNIGGAHDDPNKMFFITGFPGY